MVARSRSRRTDTRRRRTDTRRRSNNTRRRSNNTRRRRTDTRRRSNNTRRRRTDTRRRRTDTRRRSNNTRRRSNNTRRRTDRRRRTDTRRSNTRRSKNVPVNTTTGMPKIFVINLRRDKEKWSKYKNDPNYIRYSACNGVEMSKANPYYDRLKILWNAGDRKRNVQRVFWIPIWGSLKRLLKIKLIRH